MKEENDTIRIYLRLGEDLTKYFLRIKKHLGLKTNTEVLRTLINIYWREHQDDLK